MSNTIQLPPGVQTDEISAVGPAAEKPKGLMLGVEFIPGEQRVVLHFDVRDYQTWPFVKSILGMAQDHADAMAREAQLEAHMKRAQAAAADKRLADQVAASLKNGRR